MPPANQIQVVDSHTGGEPTRVVLAGFPNLGSGSLRERLEVMQGRYDAYRSAIVNEPRGSQAVVGAMLTEPTDSSCATGVIFFNNVGYLGMCGHGTIGVAATLAHLGRIAPGEHRFETPVGIVEVNLLEDGSVSLENVPSYRLANQVVIDVPGYGPVKGDIAWGGNWFFLTQDRPCSLERGNIDRLTAFAWSIRRALASAGTVGAQRAEIDHIFIHAESASPDSDSRNFVLCPGGSYDRSPCGTGTSARLACLYADGMLKPGSIWRQEGLLGSVFEGSFFVRNSEFYPVIKGRAYIVAEATLIIQPQDPFGWGIPA